MAPPKTLKKAYRAFKDSTEVGIAHVNSDYAELDVAIVKATRHVAKPPKEKHIRTIIIATTVVPRVDVVYCIKALSRRLTKTHSWTVAMKILIVLHRTLRECDPTFREELLNFSRKGRILKLSNFLDDSSPAAWDCSASVRTYALFLEERLECFRVLKYDIESERIPSFGQGRGKGHSRTRGLNSSKLLEQLPALQQLLHRLIGCRPEGVAAGNCVIQSAFALVLKESFNIYCAINDGIINLVDKFFEMSKHEALKALEIYKRAGEQAHTLADFYGVCKGLELTRNFQFPVLREPPRSFLVTMEEYIKEAPQVVPVPQGVLDSPKRLMLKCKPVEASSSSQEARLPNEKNVTSDILPVTSGNDVPPTATPPKAHIDIDDLLGLNVDTPYTYAAEDRDSLLLAIRPNDGTSNSYSDHANVFDPSGWEIPTVTAPARSLSAATENQLAGGLDMLTLNSLYKEGEYRALLQPLREVQAKNPFDTHEAFVSSNYLMTATSAQMISNPQLPQMHLFDPLHHGDLPLHDQLSVTAPSNPFSDAGIMSLEPQTWLSHNSTMPYGSMHK